MSEQESHPEQETLPEESPTAGEAAQEKGDVEWGEKGAEKGEGHPAREHDEPQM